MAVRKEKLVLKATPDVFLGRSPSGAWGGGGLGPGWLRGVGQQFLYGTGTGGAAFAICETCACAALPMCQRGSASRLPLLCIININNNTQLRAATATARRERRPFAPVHVHALCLTAYCVLCPGLWTLDSIIVLTPYALLLLHTHAHAPTHAVPHITHTHLSHTHTHTCGTRYPGGSVLQRKPALRTPTHTCNHNISPLPLSPPDLVWSLTRRITLRLRHFCAAVLAPAHISQYFILTTRCRLRLSSPWPPIRPHLWVSAPSLIGLTNTNAFTELLCRRLPRALIAEARTRFSDRDPA
jgi:hypothetical protein